MSRQTKEPLVAVCYRIRPEVRTWLAIEAAQKHDRPATWLVNKLLDEAYSQAKQQPQGVAQ
jgi:hypothetical protein